MYSKQILIRGSSLARRYKTGLHIEKLSLSTLSFLKSSVGLARLPANCSRRIFSAMSQPVKEDQSLHNNGADNKREVNFLEASNNSVIRYQPGDERFQMQVTLKSGKSFNFDRKCEDSVSNVVARMVTNISKKMKKFDGSVKFILGGAEYPAADSEDKPEEDGTEIDKILRTASTSPNGHDVLKLRIGEDVYDVIFNPPEMFSVKFLSIYMPTFPLFPYRMEASSNFSKKDSLYKWEFSRDKPTPEVPAKLRKKSKDQSVEGGGGDSSNSSKENSSWVECGSSMLLTPEKGMEGGYLKFSCIPSNGSTYGKPFSMTLANPIATIPVERFLYEERLSRMTPKRTEGDYLRVLSYNVLADTYATPEWFISSPKDSLDAGFRLPILNKELQLYGADLICLQEVDEKYFEGNFEPFLGTLGYKGVHTCKTGNTKEGIAMFHNPLKLECLQSHDCVILDHMKTMPLWERLLSVGNDFTTRLEERNTVFHISVFHVKHLPKTIVVAGNVHLYFHPDADHIRLLQTITCINFLETKLSQLKEQYPDHRITVIYCGDLNCTPPFSSYRLLTQGQIDENDEDWSSHSEEKIVPGIPVKHSLNLTNSHPNEELTNITTCFEGCLDYILFQSEHLELLQSYPPPSKEEIAVLTKEDEVRKVSLPNFYTPSDHLPLIADFKIKSEIK
ncbi:2',5'-phosphodiesterase 12 [Orchesella cincta]|uniref:2',5'-phosphodiesterase 12 n=1 Tax=Orchesella cincta TaxID=48709 RepID=A0A1D2NK77_ORCCI|nr:2',5'-phosphodiesterase 12 [Orchesella cincta]